MKTAQLQQALYDRLTGYTAVDSAVAGIYTTVPQVADSGDASAFPFITIGPFIESPNDTKTSDGVTVLADVHTWSRSRSALTWRQIADDVYDALQKYALPVSGVNVIDCRFDSSAEYDDADGVTKHHVSTFRITYFNA